MQIETGGMHTEFSAVFALLPFSRIINLDRDNVIR